MQTLNFLLYKHLYLINDYKRYLIIPLHRDFYDLL